MWECMPIMGVWAFNRVQKLVEYEGYSKIQHLRVGLKGTNSDFVGERFRSLFLCMYGLCKRRCQNSPQRAEKSFAEMHMNCFYDFCGKLHVINPPLRTGIISHIVYFLQGLTCRNMYT